jgi:16S rRNA C967 or C1407 C5-methylase (RsmB/RsmF family)
MTAAPGGKTLVLLSGAIPNSIHVNEIDPDRRTRLRRVLDDYVSPDVIIPTITGKDATRASSFSSGTYSKVLLDAPCSTERHLIQSMMKSDRSGNLCPEMMNWSPRLTIRCHEVQVRLLLRAIECCKVGGRICYSTCSISPLENDGVIHKVMKELEKRALKGCKKSVSEEPFDEDDEFLPASISILRREWPIGERSEFGWFVLPNQSFGWGPIYLCLLERTS